MAFCLLPRKAGPARKGPSPWRMRTGGESEMLRRIQRTQGGGAGMPGAQPADRYVCSSDFCWPSSLHSPLPPSPHSLPLVQPLSLLCPPQLLASSYSTSFPSHFLIPSSRERPEGEESASAVPGVACWHQSRLPLDSHSSPLFLLRAVRPQSGAPLDPSPLWATLQ